MAPTRSRCAVFTSPSPLSIRNVAAFAACSDPLESGAGSPGFCQKGFGVADGVAGFRADVRGLCEPASPGSGRGAQFGCANKRRDGAESIAAEHRPTRHSIEAPGGRVVRSDRGGGQMPGLPFLVTVQRVGEDEVGVAPFLVGGHGDYRRPNQRVPERDSGGAVVDVYQLRPLGGCQIT